MPLKTLLCPSLSYSVLIELFCCCMCKDWSEASGFTCSKMFNEQRQKQTGNGQQAKTGISEAEQRRKQYQAGVEVTGTGSEFQGRAVQGQTQRWQEE